ncbi:hypothetical protein Ddye_028274 [Dipteronia dyeriana]|uniref:Transmembrane protein n=1 Tax=Dipteronia dyeriana TaxID=168575 RepID=A0AAD9TQN4_9ROSI|nr:hypothetical protein Ddye_028274 [Dipteronia dyeriana]
MSTTLHFNSHSHFLLCKKRFISNPVVEPSTFLQSTNFAAKAPVFRSTLSVSRRTHVQKPIICAKKNKRRSGFQRSGKYMLQLMSVFASNLKFLPQPLDLIVTEFGGGDGGGLGFLKGFGGGGGGFGRQGRGKNRNLWLLVFLSCFGFLFSLFGRELKMKSEVFYGVLGFSVFFGAILVRGLKRNVKDWIFGFCCLGFLVGSRLRREEVRKWVDQFRICSPIVEIFRGKRKSRRRAL